MKQSFLILLTLLSFLSITTQHNQAEEAKRLLGNFINNLPAFPINYQSNISHMSSTFIVGFFRATEEQCSKYFQKYNLGDYSQCVAGLETKINEEIINNAYLTKRFLTGIPVPGANTYYLINYVQSNMNLNFPSTPREECRRILLKTQCTTVYDPRPFTAAEVQAIATAPLAKFKDYVNSKMLYLQLGLNEINRLNNTQMYFMDKFFE